MQNKLNKLKEILSIKTDTELGDYLGKSRKHIWELRNNKSTSKQVELILDLNIENVLLKNKLSEIQQLSKEIL